MIQKCRYIMLLLVLLHSIIASAQWNALFVDKSIRSVIPVDIIDSIKPTTEHNMDVFMNERKISIAVDTLMFKINMSDTLFVDYHDDGVSIYNPRLDIFNISVEKGMVSITATGKQPFVCRVTGRCSDGRIVIDADTTMTLVLDNLNLTSQQSSAIYFKQKENVTVELTENSLNTLEDATEYQMSDTTDISKGCIYGRGSLTFKGNGVLTVKGNYRYGIFSSKDIVFEDGSLIVDNTIKDGVRCDSFTMDNGVIILNLQNNASKGIKAKEKMVINGGRIEGEANGGVVIEDGETSYCSLLKSDGSFMMDGGEIALRNYGQGGRCISVDGNMIITAGILTLKCHGDGAYYLNTSNDSDYYTPKCITVDGSTRIERGTLNLLATGKGGKGLVCSDTLFIGRKGENFLPEDSLLIVVETRGVAIEDNVLEDFRRGCPKAIKCEGDIYGYSGNLRICTFGQGGEGIESKGSLRAYHCTIIADCYDDGINTGQRCYIDGAHIFCRSINNDGIDSNGKMTVMDGIVSAISEHFENESFDTEGVALNVYGGHIIGIGNDEVSMSQNTLVPYYSTPSWRLRFGYQCGDSIVISHDRYLTISKGGEAIISLRHEYASDDAFITVASMNMQKNENYSISDGEKPSEPLSEWLDNRVVIGGILSDNNETIINFQTY